MGLVMDLNMIAVAANSILFALLFALYVRVWREVPTGFTLGLAFFALVLLLQNAVQLYFFLTMMPYYVEAEHVQVFVLVQNLMATLAVVVLLAVTWSPSGADAPPPVSDEA